METSSQATEPQKGSPRLRIRLRLSLTPAHLCYRHLHGKTELEARAWATMALEHMAALVDMAGKEVNSPVALATPVAVPNKLPWDKVALHAVSDVDVEPSALPPRSKLAEKIPGTGSLLSATRSAFKKK